MRSRQEPADTGRPGANAVLVTLAATTATFTVAERPVNVSPETYDNYRAALEPDNSDAIPIELTGPPQEDHAWHASKNLVGSWPPSTPIHHVIEGDIPVSNPLQAIQRVTLTTMTAPNRSPFVWPSIRLNAPEPPSSSSFGTWVTAPPSLRRTDTDTTTIRFDAPPEIDGEPLLGPTEPSLRIQSRLQVNGLLTALARQWGPFQVRELVWELDEAEYSAFRERYDAGSSGGAGIWATDDAGRVLLIQHTGDTAWSEPGGKREPNETFTTAAKREFKEEAGIKPEITGVQEVHAIVHIDTAHQREPIASPIVIFSGTATGDPSAREDKINAAEWWSTHPDDLLYPELADFPIPASPTQSN